MEYIVMITECADTQHGDAAMLKYRILAMVYSNMIEFISAGIFKNVYTITTDWKKTGNADIGDCHGDINSRVTEPMNFHAVVFFRFPSFLERHQKVLHRQISPPYKHHH